MEQHGSKQNVTKLLVVLLSNQRGVLCTHTHRAEQLAAACWFSNITKVNIVRNKSESRLERMN